MHGAVLPDPDRPIAPFDRTLWVDKPSALYESANLFVRRELFERIGGFESLFRPARGIEMGEDVLFGWRARRLGVRIVFCHGAVVHHAVFDRGPRAYVAERARLRFFPAAAARVPELPGAFLLSSLVPEPAIGEVRPRAGRRTRGSDHAPISSGRAGGSVSYSP